MCKFDFFYSHSIACVILLNLLSLRDDTRTSYLLQAVESAWDSIGKKRPVTASSANQSGDTVSKAYPDTRPALMEAAGGGAMIGEELRGAEAMMDIPRKGANVSSLTAV